MTDLSKRCRVLPCWIAVAHKQLQNAGHLARLPSERAERWILWAWLDHDVDFPGRQNVQTTHQQLWQRIRQDMQLSGEPEDTWTTSWFQVAAKNEGDHWRSAGLALDFKIWHPTEKLYL